MTEAQRNICESQWACNVNIAAAFVKLVMNRNETMQRIINRTVKKKKKKKEILIKNDQSGFKIN